VGFSDTALAGVNVSSIPNNGCLFPTITAALAYASPGDTLYIDVTDTYEENVVIDMPLTLVGSNTSCDGPAAQGSRAVLKPDPVTPDSVVQIDLSSLDVVTLRGLEIREGNAERGGGVHAHHTDVVLDDTVIGANYAADGGGVFVENGSLHSWSLATGPTVTPP